MPYFHKPETLEQHLTNFNFQFEKTKLHFDQALKSQSRIDFDTLQIALDQLTDESAKLKTAINSVLNG